MLRTISASSGTITSFRSFTAYPSGTGPPIHMPFFLEAATLSRMRSPATSRSNWAKDNSTLSVNLPIEVEVLNCWVTATKDTLLPIQHLVELGEVGEGSGQPVDLVDDDDVDLAGINILQQLLRPGRSMLPPE